MDPVRQYRERFRTLWTVLEKIFYFVFPGPIEGCNGSCEQGKIPCDCGKYGASEKNLKILKKSPRKKVTEL